MDDQETKSKISPVVVVLFVSVIVLAVLYFTKQPAQKTPEVKQTSPTVQREVVQTTESTTTIQPAGTEIKKFTITAQNFSYDVKEIKVKKGDKVQINFVNSDGFHDWRLDEFGAKTKVIKSGETDMVEFVADKAGTFEYYCSVGAHRAMGMKGNLVVD